jgi:hypothetical protein
MGSIVVYFYYYDVSAKVKIIKNRSTGLDLKPVISGIRNQRFLMCRHILALSIELRLQ